MKFKKKLIIFDLDGVLFDSKKNMKRSWLAVKKKYNLKIPFSKYFLYLGLPFEEICNNLKIQNQDINKIKMTYNSVSSKERNIVKTYPGVKKTLNILRDKYKLAIVTSKNFKRAKELIKHNNLEIKKIVTPNKKLKGKPRPDTIIKVINDFRFSASDSIYIGDTDFDYIACQKSKIDFIFANYGYGIRKKKYKYVINKFNDLLKLL